MPPLSRLLVIFLLLEALAVPARARVALIDADVGLSDKHITSIMRDSRGLMWVGTRHGLCAYDGYRFIPFSAPELQTAAVNRLHYVPGTDILWVSCDTSLLMLHCRELRLRRVRIPREGALTATTLGSDMDLYTCFRSGRVYQIDTSGTPRLIGRMPQGPSAGDYCSRISTDPTGLLLLRGEQSNRYFSLDPRGGGAVSPVSRETGSMNLAFIKSAAGLRAMFGEERLFLQAATTALRYPSPQASHYWLSNIIDVGADPAGHLYALGRPSKLYRLTPGNPAIDTVSSELFTGRTFNCSYADPEGIIWVGTNKGLLKISTDTRFFTQLLIQAPPVSVRSIEMDENGHFYAGTYSGLFRSPDDGHTWQRISGQIPNRIVSAPGPWIYFVGGDSTLYRIRKTDGAVSTGFWRGSAPGRQQTGDAYALFRQGGRLWIGGSHGLFHYEPATGSFSEWEGNAQFPPHVHVNSISAGEQAGLRVCTNAGLFEFDSGGRLRARFGTATRPALSDERLLHATPDSAGRLWLCTSGGGINILSPDRKSVSVLNTRHGLSNNETYQIIWQGDEAWISTFNGLSRYDLRDRTFRNYYSSDGLTTNEFNHNAFLLDGRQRIWFGTINGINRFAPQDIPSTARRAALFVSSLSKWDSRLRALREIPAADTSATIELLPQDHSLSFTLGLTDYSLTENNTFMYRLPGVFDEWVRLEGAQALRLDGLAAGTYTLEIRALDGRGIPASNMLRYRILVREVFYKTWPFYLALFLVTTLLIWGFFRLRLQNIKRVQRLRQQIASDLHDEVGSLLTRITMTSENLRYSRNPEPEKAAKLEKIAALSRNASSSMSDILWAIDARNDYTGNLSDRIQEHAEEMLVMQDAELQFDIQISQRMSISSQFRQQLYLIFKEAINNVAKHSRAAQVQILYHHNERGFRLEVRNDGLREAEKSSVRSQGLKNMEMRARRIGARIRIRSEDGWFSVVLSGR